MYCTPCTNKGDDGVLMLQLVFDDDAISSHKLTTNEIKECCKDIKVLGKKELRSVKLVLYSRFI